MTLCHMGRHLRSICVASASTTKRTSTDQLVLLPHTPTTRTTSNRLVPADLTDLWPESRSAVTSSTTSCLLLCQRTTESTTDPRALRTEIRALSSAWMLSSAKPISPGYLLAAAGRNLSGSRRVYRIQLRGPAIASLCSAIQSTRQPKDWPMPQTRTRDGSHRCWVSSRVRARILMLS
jgi:hypothetical protein